MIRHHCGNCRWFTDGPGRCGNPLNAELGHASTYNGGSTEVVIPMRTSGYMVCDHWSDVPREPHHRKAYEPKLGGKAKVIRNRSWMKGDPDWSRARSVESAEFMSKLIASLGPLI